MTGLDPTGDWLGRGARALDNPRTATGEESLERLRSFLDDLNQGGKRSETFLQLKKIIVVYILLYFSIRDAIDWIVLNLF